MNKKPKEVQGCSTPFQRKDGKDKELHTMKEQSKTPNKMTLTYHQNKMTQAYHQTLWCMHRR